MGDENTETPKSNNSGDTPEGIFDFLKKYINGWVATALLLPTAVTWKGMPEFESQRGLLVTYTGLACALVLALLFANRSFIRGTAKVKSRLGIFGKFVIPLVLIAATIFCGYEYVEVLKDAAQYYDGTFSDALKHMDLDQIHGGAKIMAYDIGIMLFAECAFFFMALREWNPTDKSSKDDKS